MNPLMLRTRSPKLKVTRFRIKGPDCICCRPGTKMKESASHHINRIIDKDAPEDICRNIVRQHKEIWDFEPFSRSDVVGLGWFWNVSNFSSWCVFWKPLSLRTSSWSSLESPMIILINSEMFKIFHKFDIFDIVFDTFGSGRNSHRVLWPWGWYLLKL